VADAFRIGMTLDEIFEETAIDPWFLAQIEQLIQVTEQRSRGASWTA
jgi:carbamoyl-phosphate synthase large subunit